MGQIITLSRINTFVTREGEDDLRKEKITCPQGVQVSSSEVRDRQSGHVLAWRDSRQRWHSTGTGVVYTRIDVSDAEE